MDPNAVGLDDVATAGFIGSIVYSTIEIVHGKKPLSSEMKAWLAPVLSFLFVAACYIALAIAENTLFPLPKVLTLAWQAYGHSQGQHNISAAIATNGVVAPTTMPDGGTPTSSTFADVTTPATATPDPTPAPTDTATPTPAGSNIYGTSP